MSVPLGMRTRCPQVSTRFFHKMRTLIHTICPQIPNHMQQCEQGINDAIKFLYKVSVWIRFDRNISITARSTTLLSTLIKKHSNFMYIKVTFYPKKAIMKIHLSLAALMFLGPYLVSSEDQKMVRIYQTFPFDSHQPKNWD